MQTDIFHLKIIPIENILPHEQYDESRCVPLMEKISQDRMFTNPIIVAHLWGDQYVQLDGMNRFSAMKTLRYKSILCQIIDYNDQESVELSSWSHLFKGDIKGFLAYLTASKEINIRTGRIDNVGHRYIKEEGSGRLCTVCANDGSVYLVNSNGVLADKLGYLNFLVKYYEKKIVRDMMPERTSKSDIDALFSTHPNANILIVFPTFTRHQILEMVKKSLLFPAGITRHLIKRRCLNVNVPLSAFEASMSIENQNRELEDILVRKKFRLYEEPTVYFE